MNAITMGIFDARYATQLRDNALTAYEVAISCGGAAGSQAEYWHTVNLINEYCERHDECAVPFLPTEEDLALMEDEYQMFLSSSLCRV